ncbi:hypothetical protein GCM10009789_38610 [Kribbella sancticallisti]|uniref:DUF3105 domain-containing protein n=1 Tax=Kribbella sancticallisti TaxID=460087 RepID=A0ABP4PHB0_9ACTN
MSSKGKQSRRQLIEQMQRDQARSDRRRTILIIAVCLVVGLGIVAYPAIKLVQDSRAKSTPTAEIGVPADQASCGDIVESAASGSSDHKPDGTAIAYATSPPSSGPHYQTWAPFSRKFYTADDRPALGNLVHNLEHGYTILWYNDTIAGDSEKTAVIERLAKSFGDSQTQAGKFIAAPYTTKDGGDAWPAGKNIAFAHWSGGPPEAQKANRQYCGDISGAALKTFMDKYPADDSPEPNAG